MAALVCAVAAQSSSAARTRAWLRMSGDLAAAVNRSVSLMAWLHALPRRAHTSTDALPRPDYRCGSRVRLSADGVAAAAGADLAGPHAHLHVCRAAVPARR